MMSRFYGVERSHDAPIPIVMRCLTQVTLRPLKLYPVIQYLCVCSSSFLSGGSRYDLFPLDLLRHAAASLYRRIDLSCCL